MALIKIIIHEQVVFASVVIELCTDLFFSR